MHAFIFWGFIVLLPTILMAMISAVDGRAELPWLGRQEWFGWLADVFCVLVLAGVTTAVVIRKVVRPERFRGSHLGEADFILFMIAGVVTTLLFWHASAYAVGLYPAAGPLSRAMSHAFSPDAPTRIASSSGRHLVVRLRLPLVHPALEAPPHRDRGGRTSGSRERARKGGSSRCASTFPTTSFASASRRSPT